MGLKFRLRMQTGSKGNDFPSHRDLNRHVESALEGGAGVERGCVLPRQFAPGTGVGDRGDPSVRDHPSAIGASAFAYQVCHWSPRPFILILGKDARSQMFVCEVMLRD